MKILPINNLSNKNNIHKQYKYTLASITKPASCDTVCFKGINKTVAPKIIILLGAPNSGKGTCARQIAQKYSIPQISLGDVFRREIKYGTALGAEVKTYMESGGLVPDNIIIDVLTNRITQEDCKNGFILDGFPRTIPQAERFDEILKNIKGAELRIINLDVDKKILYKRSANRYICPECSRVYSLEKFDPKTSVCECGSKLIKRADDTPDVLTKRLENYEKQTMPLLNYYGNKVDYVGIHGIDVPAEETFARVDEKLG